MNARLGFLVAISSLAAGCQCAGNAGGVHAGDRIQTTVIARDTDPGTHSHARVQLAEPSCGDLGDLVPGAVLVSTASFSGPDSCSPNIELAPESLSTATRVDTSTIQMPDGCSGLYRISVEPNDASILDNGLDDAGEPSWWLVRQFTLEGDASVCPGVTQSPCEDAFIVRSARVP